MKLILFWINNARNTALPQSLLAAILAFCMASQSPNFSWILGLIAVLGVICAHLGINLLDDYFDYQYKETSYRERMTHQGFRARIAKCDYLTSGQATLHQLRIACLVFCLLALICGVVIFLHCGKIILWFMLATLLLGFFYSGPPLRISYRGLGELQVGFMFGPMLMNGVYYAACGTFSLSVLLLSIPVGLLVANILFTHSIMDYEPDKQVGKMTFAILLGKKKYMLITLFILLLVSFGMVVGGIFWGNLSPWFCLIFILLPMAIGLFYLMVEFVKNPNRTFQPQFWMGPMGRWEEIKTVGIDWFMIRWYLARNLLTFFCLISVVVTFI